MSDNNKNANPMIYIMSGYNQRAVIAFLRYLEKIEYYDYSIIAVNSEDLILKTPYKSHVIYIRKVKQLTIEEFKDIFDHDLREGIFMPSTEALVRFQLEHRDYFEKQGITIPIVKKSLYELVSDKRKFWELCKNHALKVPKVYSDKEKIEFPIVVKPRTYLLSTNEIISPQIIRSQKELDIFIEGRNKHDFDYQQFITGESYYLLFYIGRDGVIYSFSQKNIFQQHNGKSMIAAEPSHIHEEKVSKDYGEMLKGMGFYGLIMIELRKHKNDYYMIEANPRMWGPSQLFVDADVDFFGYLLKDYGIQIEIEKKPANYSVRFFWSGGYKGKLQDFRISETDINSEDFSIFEMYDIFNRRDTLEIYRYEAEQKDDL